MTRPARAALLILSVCAAAAPGARGQSAPDLDRPPVVIVPGAPATQLIDSATGRRMWPGVWRMLGWHGNDVLALDLSDPESTTLRPGKLVRSIRIAGVPFAVRGYDGLEAKLRAMGYREGDLAAPRAGEYYIFLYDWRLSVESSARRFQAAMRDLYARLPPGTPRAVVIGHSIGGLIARYALMYGDAPLGASGPLPPVTWAGGATMDTVYLVATPNGGTFLALDALQRGTFWWKHWGGFSPDLLATFPAMYDLMPVRHEPLLDARGRPLEWSLARAEDWEKIGWGPLRSGSRFAGRKTATLEMVRAQLARAQRLHDALLQTGARPSPTELRLVGGRCQSAQRTAVVIERSDGAPSVRFRTSSPGVRIEAADRAMLRAVGDSMITTSALRAAGLPHEPTGSLVFESSLYACETHNHLPSSPVLLEDLEAVLRATSDRGAPVATGRRGPAGSP